MNKGIGNWQISNASKADSGKTLRRPIQIPRSVSKNRNVGFTVAIIICQSRYIINQAEYDAGESVV